MPAKKTTRQLIMSGTLLNNPGRYMNRATACDHKAGPLGEPPSQMANIEKAIWHEIAANAGEGWLTASDRLLVELACRLTRRLRNPKAAILNSEMNTLANILSKLGMSPTDRTKVDAPPETATPVADDPWEQLTRM
jgi:hypothetical protein